jgi:serine/threonine-protein kinase
VTGELFGPYRLDELIGRGGMGEVHRAYDTGRERAVALKRLPAELAGNADFQARFRHESRVAARLTEPHIIPIHDFGEIDGRLFIDMRLVLGTDLATLLRQRGPMPADRAVHIVSQVASGLAAAHAERLVHRDVKPSNVLLTGSNSGQDYAYLIDFGIAHTPTTATMTAAGTTVGTLAYMAPERFLGHPVDHRIDIYALGCLLYECLTACRPFPGEDTAALAYAHLNAPPPAPSTRQPGVPASLDAVVANALAKDPDRRYQGALDLAAAARAALSNPLANPLTRPPTMRMTNPTHTGLSAHAAPTIGPPIEAGRKRRRLPLVIAGVVTALALTAVVAVLVDPKLARWTATDGPSSGAAPSIASPTSNAPASSAPAPGPAPTVVATVAVGAEPWAVAVAPDGRHTYLTNGMADTVSVLDNGSNTIVATIPVGKRPHGVALSPDGRRAYVTNLSGGSVSVLDTAANTVVATVPIGRGDSPDGVAVTPDGRQVYVTNDDADSVSVINTDGNTVTKTIRVGKAPDGIAITPDGRQAYVANQSSASVSVIDTATNAVTGTIDLPGAKPVRLAITPDGSRAYLTNGGALLVVSTDHNTVAATIPVGVKLAGLVITPDGRQTYVVDTSANSVSIVDNTNNAVRNTVGIGQAPRGASISPDGRHVYLTNSHSNTLTVLDTNAR